jgi:HAE1 family hydrophobic/amphiphilic exporter-1
MTLCPRFSAGALHGGSWTSSASSPIGVAVLISGFISLTLTPMLSSRFLRPPREVEHHALYNAFERGFTGMLKGYKSGLSWSLAHRRTMIVITLAITILMGFLFAWVPKGFIPSQDVGQLSGQTEAVEGISFDSMARHQQAIAAILKADPNIESFGSSAGGRGGGASNSGFVFIRLKPRNQRDLSADEIVESLRPKLAAVPGVRTYIQSPPAIQIGGRQSRPHQLTLQPFHRRPVPIRAGTRGKDARQPPAPGREHRSPAQEPSDQRGHPA